MISIENLSKKYGSKKVLDSISIHLEKGKVYGVVGENGAGKTTFFECLCGLTSHSGNINPSPKKLKQQMGYLLTNPTFLSYTTGREHLKLLCNARSIKISDLDNKNVFNLPLDQYATSYSTGMKKKLALLGILLQKNEIFILDEPFNGVDIQSNMMIIEIINQLKHSGKTILIASHIFSTLNTLCDSIMVLDSGKISKTVSPENFNDLEQDMKQFSSIKTLDILEL
jgi:ABC-2 type transport system ATP-binding protein